MGRRGTVMGRKEGSVMGRRGQEQGEQYSTTKWLTIS